MPPSQIQLLDSSAVLLRRTPIVPRGIYLQSSKNYRSVILLIQPEQGTDAIGQRKCALLQILFAHQLARGGAKMQRAREVFLDLLSSNFKHLSTK